MDIQIPAFDEKIPSRESVLGTPKPTAPTAAPAQTQQEDTGTSEFLKSVREANARKSTAGSDDSVTENRDQPPAAPAKPNHPEPSSDEAGNEDTEGDNESDFDPAEAALPRKSKAISIRDLKKSLNSERERAKALEEKVQAAEAERERYADVDEQLEELDRLRERNKQLESLEQVIDIQSNPEFQKKYVDGKKALEAEAQKLSGEHYGVDPAVITHAATITNRKELNEFLSKHYRNSDGTIDQIAVGEIRPYILQIQQLDTERQQLEKSPEQAREQLSHLVRQNQSKRIQEASEKIKLTTQEAWVEIVNHYSRGPAAVEFFKDKPGDAAHNALRDDILNRANAEYAKASGVFARLGATEIPKGLAQSLAARYQLSELAGHLNHEVNRLNKEVNDLQAKLNKEKSFTRPGYSNSGSPESRDSKTEMRGKSLAEHAFVSAGEKLAAQGEK